jgi:hypothetical protein
MDDDRARRLPRRVWILLAVGALATASCSPRVPRPTSDSTPPTLEWVVTNDETNEQQTFAGSGSVQASQGDSFLVTLKAKDPEGILQITISSNVGWGCSSGDLGQNVGPSLGSVDEHSSQEDAEGKVPTELFMLRDVDLGPYDCQSGLSFDGATETINGSGTNYLNLDVQGTLTFNVPS